MTVRANPWVWVRKGRKPLRFPTLHAAQEYIRMLGKPNATVYGPKHETWRRIDGVWFREDQEGDLILTRGAEPDSAPLLAGIAVIEPVPAAALGEVA